MKVVSNKPRGSRMFKSVTFKLTSGLNEGCKVRRPLWISPVDMKWQFNLTTDQWVSEYDNYSGLTNSYYAMTWKGYHNVYSLKAAKRLIAKWDVPKGTKFIVSLPFVGYEFTVTK